MKTETFTVHGRQIHLEGYPDAVKLIVLNEPRARQLAHYKMHDQDLELSWKALQSIDIVDNEDTKEILWRFAIINYCKCFRSALGRTTQLDPKIIYSNYQNAIVAYQYFMDLRNKHLVHDENSLADTIPCAAINGGGKDYKIEQVLVVSNICQTREPGNRRNLDNLICRAREWINYKFDNLCSDLARALEEDTLAGLLARKNVEYTVPALDEMNQTRRPLR